jgi:hypothetical protein
VVDGLGETKLVDAGLETALEEIVSLEGKDSTPRSTSTSLSPLPSVVAVPAVFAARRPLPPPVDTGVVDGLGETKLVDAGLETALEEIVSLEGKDVSLKFGGLGANFSSSVSSLLSTRRTPSVSSKAMPSFSQNHRLFLAHTEQHDGSWRG